MHFKLGTKYLFSILSVALFASFVIFLNALDSGSYSLDSESESLYSKIKAEDKVVVWVQLKDFDAASQTLKVRLWIYPPERFAVTLNSSVQVKYDTVIGIDAAKVEYNDRYDNYGFWTALEYLRALDIELDADDGSISSNDDIWFPFDRYSLFVQGNVRFRVEGGNTDSETDDVYESLPVEVRPYTSNLSGWSATFKASSYDGQTKGSTFREGQRFRTQIVLERTSLNKVLTLLLGLIFLGGGLSMLVLFRSILMNHRPPTLSGLIWAGSTAFTMIQTRTVIPGAPRVGVKFDLLIFYPSLVMCFISGGLMFYHWVSKETWSREL